jgi:hypothetical protein
MVFMCSGIQGGTEVRFSVLNTGTPEYLNTDKERTCRLLIIG